MINPITNSPDRHSLLLSKKSGSCFSGTRGRSRHTACWSGIACLFGLGDIKDRELVFDLSVWHSNWSRVSDVQSVIQEAELMRLYDDIEQREVRATHVASMIEGHAGLILPPDDKAFHLLRREALELVNVGICAARDRIKEEDSIFDKIDLEEIDLGEVGLAS